jgi:Fic-DOC domain mobile mystery protein B
VPTVDPLLPLGDGHTPLDDGDREALKASYVSTRGELNEAEQENILRVITRRRPPTVDALLNDRYLRELHRAMFGDVWTWAGRYRRRETTIGIDPAQIAVAVRNLVADGRVCVDSGVESHDTIGVRFHHRLVSIHPFPNGNGRHSRLAADYLVRALGQDRFSWGADLALETPDLRQRYLDALRRADDGDLADLVSFARS